MVWCLSCNAEVTAEVDDTRGFTCCTQCGVVLDETAFSTDPTFSKTPGGAATVDGNFVPDGGGAPGLGRVRGARIFGYQVRQAALRGQTKSEGGLNNSWICVSAVQGEKHGLRRATGALLPQEQQHAEHEPPPPSLGA